MGKIKNEMIDAEAAVGDINPKSILVSDPDLFYEEVVRRLEKAKHPGAHNIALSWAVDRYLRDERNHDTLKTNDD